MLPLSTNIKDAYSNGQDEEQKFIQNLAMFLCTFLKDHGSLIEKPEHNEGLLKVSFTFTSKLRRGTYREKKYRFYLFEVIVL